MALPLIAAGVAGAIKLGGAIAKGIKARKQRKEAEKINPIRPIMGRTRASRELQARSRRDAQSTRLPGQSYAENQIGAQTARANTAIQQTGGSTGEIIAGLSTVDENARRSTNDLAFQGAQLNQENKRMYGQVLQGVSQEQREMFDYNQNQPFQTETLRKQALLDSSARNTDNAWGSASDAVGDLGVAAGYKNASTDGVDTGLDEGIGASAKRKRKFI